MNNAVREYLTFDRMICWCRNVVRLTATIVVLFTSYIAMGFLVQESSAFTEFLSRYPLMVFVVWVALMSSQLFILQNLYRLFTGHRERALLNAWADLSVLGRNLFKVGLYAGGALLGYAFFYQTNPILAHAILVGYLIACGEPIRNLANLSPTAKPEQPPKHGTAKIAPVSELEQKGHLK